MSKRFVLISVELLPVSLSSFFVLHIIVFEFVRVMKRLGLNQIVLLYNSFGCLVLCFTVCYFEWRGV